MSPFPDPAHQTGRADFLHPAFGQGTQRSRTRWNPAPPSLKPLNVVCTCRGFKAFLGPRGANRFPLVTSNAALEPRSLRSTIITRFFTTMDLSDSQFSPAPILADRRLLGLAPKHCAGSPVLTPLSFTHIPPPLPRSSQKMLSTLSSLPGFGLRLAPTISTGTLGFRGLLGVQFSLWSARSLIR